MKTAAVALALSVIASAAFAEDAIKLAVGARGNWETAAAELGQQAGFFKRHGIALEILYTQGSGETQQAVTSGTVAIGVRLATTSPDSAFSNSPPPPSILHHP